MERKEFRALGRQPNSNESQIAARALKLWQSDRGSLCHVGSSANAVYTFIESGRRRYLRLTSALRRTRAHIEAELDFIAHLRAGGVRAVIPVPSVRGQLVEEVSSESDLFFSCVFEHAEGEEYDLANCGKQHFLLRGRTLGLIHALSKQYVQSNPSRRFAWNDDELLLQVDQFLPCSETAVWRAYTDLKQRLQHYPRSASTFGLIHGDFGETNHRYQNNQLQIFDFDDCCYHWFTYDLAIAIYPHGSRREGLQFLDSLLAGYAENMSSKVTLREVTMFCQWRLIYMFLVYARKWGFMNLSKHQAEWFARKRENIVRSYEWGAQ